MTALPIDEADVLRPFDPAVRMRLYNPQAAAELAAKQRASEIARAKAEAAKLQRRFDIELENRERIASARAKFEKIELPRKSANLAIEIIQVVADTRGFDVAAMLTRPDFAAARARHEAMYRVAIAFPKLSYRAIADLFGCSDHSTVWRGIERYCAKTGIEKPPRLCPWNPKRNIARRPRALTRAERLVRVERMREWSQQ